MSVTCVCVCAVQIAGVRLVHVGVRARVRTCIMTTWRQHLLIIILHQKCRNIGKDRQTLLKGKSTLFIQIKGERSEGQR